jgi:hypothetical protein
MSRNLVAQLRPLGPKFTRRTISGGHYLQLDREPAVTAELRDFVAALDSRAWRSVVPRRSEAVHDAGR